MRKLEQLKYKNKQFRLFKKLKNDIGDIFFDDKSIDTYFMNQQKIKNATNTINKLFVKEKCKIFSEKSYPENLKIAFEYLNNTLIQKYNVYETIIICMDTSGVELKVSDFLTYRDKFYSYFVAEYTNNNILNDLMILDNNSNTILNFFQMEDEMYFCSTHQES
jgi:hypothetical protein